MAIGSLGCTVRRACFSPSQHSMIKIPTAPPLIYSTTNNNKQFITKLTHPPMHTHTINEAQQPQMNERNSFRAIYSFFLNNIVLSLVVRRCVDVFVFVLTNTIPGAAFPSTVTLALNFKNPTRGPNISNDWK